MISSSELRSDLSTAVAIVVMLQCLKLFCKVDVQHGLKTNNHGKLCWGTWTDAPFSQWVYSIVSYTWFITGSWGYLFKEWFMHTWCIDNLVFGINYRNCSQVSPIDFALLLLCVFMRHSFDACINYLYHFSCIIIIMFLYTVQDVCLIRSCAVESSLVLWRWASIVQGLTLCPWRHLPLSKVCRFAD